MQDADDILTEVQSLTSLLDSKALKEKVSSHVSLVVNKVSPEDDEYDIVSTLKEIIEDRIKEDNQEIAFMLEKVISEQRIYFIRAE